MLNLKSDCIAIAYADAVGGGVSPQGRSVIAYLIFVFFSPQAQFLVKFFSTQKRVYGDKTDFATKQRKLRQKRFLQQNNFSCDKLM